jgi:hypothetical protein
MFDECDTYWVLGGVRIKIIIIPFENYITVSPKLQFRAKTIHFFFALMNLVRCNSLPSVEEIGSLVEAFS